MTNYGFSYTKLHHAQVGYLDQGKERPPSETLFTGANFVVKLDKDVDKYMQNRFGSVRMLDYGCGKAKYLQEPVFAGGKTLFQRWPNKLQGFYAFDPYFEPYACPPIGQEFDVIVCADVMEHVPETLVKWTLSNIDSHLCTSGTAFFTISGQPAKKSFLDGTNLHCTVKPWEWWKEHLTKAICKGRSWMVVYEDESGEQVHYSSNFPHRRGTSHATL